MNGDEVLKWKSTLEFLRKPLNYAYTLFCYRLHPVDQIRMTAALTVLKIPFKMLIIFVSEYTNKHESVRSINRIYSFQFLNANA